MDAITVTNFATIPGGVAFVWVLMALLDRSVPDLPTRAKIGAQAFLSLVWALLAAILFLPNGLIESLQQVVIMWFAVMAAQGFGYKTTEALIGYKTVPEALGLAPAPQGDGDAVRAQPDQPPTYTGTSGTLVHWVIPPLASGSTTATAPGNVVVLNGGAQEEWRKAFAATSTVTGSLYPYPPTYPAATAPFAAYGDQGSPEGRT